MQPQLPMALNGSHVSPSNHNGAQNGPRSSSSSAVPLPPPPSLFTESPTPAFSSSSPSTTATTTATTVIVDRQGWLEKQTNWKLKWNQRFVSLRGLTISYRHDGFDQEKACGRVRCLDTNGGYPLSFRVWTENGGSWLLRAANQEDYKQWTRAITKALIDAETSRGAEQLTATVLKKSHWKGEWRERFLLLNGLELSYKDKATDKEPKDRYEIAMCDRCLKRNEIRFESTKGDYFTVRFADEDEADRWVHAVRRAEERQHLLRWRTVKPHGEGGWYVGARGHTSSIFDAAHVVLFGGYTLGKHDVPTMQRELVLLTLLEDHPCSLVHAEGFEEAPGAKVAPVSREMAASTLLVNGTFVMYGGHSAHGEVFSDCWAVNVATRSGWKRILRPEDEPTPHASPSLHRSGSMSRSATPSLSNNNNNNTPPSSSSEAIVPSSYVAGGGGNTNSLAPRFGHSMHLPQVGGGGGSVATEHQTFIVAGGLDARFQATAEVVKVKLIQKDATYAVEVTRLAPLDQPRALHTAVQTTDAVVLVGGLAGRYNGDPASRETLAQLHRDLCVLPHGETSWRKVAAPALPPMLSPAAAAYGPQFFVWGPSDQRGEAGMAPCLYGVVLVGQCTAAVVTKYKTLGSLPPALPGLSMHIAESYAYLIGASSHEVHRLLLPSSVDAADGTDTVVSSRESGSELA